ncbi:type VI secretion system membrane subunit TssM [Azohydromonas caseinilytica]|uniref:type VI secretion system membrane subunit TssM n=1 Tax=Azohydromonas caseinilytica TaxID=2728836 RepID=UPI001F1F65F7|nr:type VI secretion system membrane subunit TssM [Azohydromonas caseinilytica]
MDARTLGVLGVALLLALVFASPLAAQVKLLVAVAVLGLPALVVLGRWLMQLWRGRRSAKRLEHALDEDLERAVRSDTTDSASQTKELREQLLGAIKRIKSSKLGQCSGQAALYELPWYMVIGHPSAGKSTAVVQSGLTFPFPHGKDNILRGIGGTRNCDWFFTSEGILLDTAGRYAMEQEHRTEWMSFLAMLKQHRPRAPINGIVVAASVAMLRDATPDAVISLGRELRARVQELTDALEVFAPVYLLFTKADLIPGFADFFADRDAHEREQVWGATLPYHTGGSDAVAQFDRHFRELQDGLKEAALVRMGLHRGQALPPAVLAFPLEFAVLQPALRSFIATLFDENPYQFRPVFRGFYFTSAVQPAETHSPDRNGVAQRFALTRPGEQPPAPAATEQGYFLKGLFSKVIFADRHLVRQHTSRAKQRLRTLSYAGGVLTLALLLAGWSWSYVGNRQLVASVQADLEKARQLQADRVDLASRLEALELLQNRLEELAAWREQRPWSLGLGLDQGDAVELRLRQEVFQGLRRVMLEPVAQALEAYLGEVNRHADQLRPLGRAVADAPPAAMASASAVAGTAAVAATPSRYAEASATEVEDAYKALKTYLMLAERQRMESGHLTDQITRFWRGWLDDNRGTMPREQLMRSAERLITFSMAHLQDPLFPVIGNNFGLVDQTRENLRRVVQGTPAIERVYADMKARASTRYAPMTVARIVGERDKALVAGSQVVSGAFTREAWQGYIKAAITEAAHNELQSVDWVLKTSTRDDLSLQGSPEQIHKTLTERYKSEYVREWQRFMQGVAVADFASFEAAVEHMNRLGDPAESPLRKLLATLFEQTSWDNPSLLDEQAAQAREGVLDWVKHSLQRLSSAPVDVKVGTGDAGPGEGGRTMGAVGREFSAVARLLAAREGGSSLQDSYFQQLGRLRSRFNTMKNQGDAGPPTRQLMAATFEGQASELSEALRFVEEQMLTGASDSAKATLKPLLVRPLIQAFAVLVVPAEDELNRLWTAQVLQPFQQTLASKYPFDAASRVEAAPAEIARVFGPTGTVARFATEVLGPLVTRRGDEISPRHWAQLGLRLRPAFVEGLPLWVAALDGAASAAPPGAGVAAAAQLSFQLRPMGAPGFIEYTVEIDGQTLRYRNGEATWSGFVWPNTTHTPGVRISGIALDGRAVELFNAPGAYGFERLIDAAQVRKLPDGVRELSWGEGAQAIALQYRAITSPGPVTPSRSGGGLRGLSLPTLVAGEERPAATGVATLPAPGAAQ